MKNGEVGKKKKEEKFWQFSRGDTHGFKGG